MEAPEKLYILFNHPHTVDYAKLNKRRHEEEVEYTRTDAFIDKACEWLNKEIPNAGLSPSSIIKFKVFNDECKKAFISDFKKYMEE